MADNEIWDWEDLEEVREYIRGKFLTDDGKPMTPVEVTRHDDGDWRGIYFLVSVQLTEGFIQIATGKDKRLKRENEMEG